MCSMGNMNEAFWQVYYLFAYNLLVCNVTGPPCHKWRNTNLKYYLGMAFIKRKYLRHSNPLYLLLPLYYSTYTIAPLSLPLTKSSFLRSVSGPPFTKCLACFLSVANRNNSVNVVFIWKFGLEFGQIWSVTGNWWSLYHTRAFKSFLSGSVVHDSPVE